MTDRYIVLIEVDNKRTLKLYREAWDGIETLWRGIEAYCDPHDTALRATWAKEDEDYLKGGVQGRMYMSPPGMYRPYWMERMPRYVTMRATIKRGLDIAQQAISPYKVTEEQAILLTDIESGDWIRRIENAIASVRPS